MLRSIAFIDINILSPLFSLQTERLGNSSCGDRFDFFRDHASKTELRIFIENDTRCDRVDRLGLNVDMYHGFHLAPSYVGSVDNVSVNYCFRHNIQKNFVVRIKARNLRVFLKQRFAGIPT